jgi:hypothetical protein
MVSHLLRQAGEFAITSKLGGKCEHEAHRVLLSYGSRCKLEPLAIQTFTLPPQRDRKHASNGRVSARQLESCNKGMLALFRIDRLWIDRQRCPQGPKLTTCPLLLHIIIATNRRASGDQSAEQIRIGMIDGSPIPLGAVLDFGPNNALSHHLT